MRALIFLTATVSAFAQAVDTSPRIATDVTTPTADQGAGKTKLYTKGGKVCALDASGTETCTGTGGGGPFRASAWVPFAGQLDGNAGRIATTMGSGSAEVSAPSFFTGATYALTGARFQDATTQTIFVSYRLHPTWTGAINLNFEGFTGSGSGTTTAVMTVSTACPAAGAAMNPPTYNTAQQWTITNVNNTALVRRTATLSNLTTTGCNAGDLMILKITRLGSDASDNMSTDLYLMGMQVDFYHN